MEHWLCLFVHTDIQLQTLLPLNRFCSISDQFTSCFFCLVRNLLSIREQRILENNVCSLKSLNNIILTFFVPSGAIIIINVHSQCLFDDTECFTEPGNTLTSFITMTIIKAG